MECERRSVMPPLVRFVDLPDKITLPFVEQGDPLGMPLLLLHGLTDSWRSFELVLPHLSGSIHAFATSQRGHGDASRPAEGYRPSDFAADLRNFMDALRLEAAVLVGHSSHSFVVTRFAVDHPERVSGLVLVGAPATLRGKPGAEALLESVAMLKDPIDPLFVRRFAEGTFHRAPPAPFVDAMIQESLRVPAYVWQQAFRDLFEGGPTAEELGRLRAPTLLVWGDRDTIVSRADQDALGAAITDSTLLVYRGTGHTHHWEEPLRFASDLSTFVEALRRA
jgi:pimeloyl-ACP methyl ester carboxylesterase